MRTDSKEKSSAHHQLQWLCTDAPQMPRCCDLGHQLIYYVSQNCLCVCLCVRPYQHGGDMLAAITLTLNQCTKPDMATPAALALQGLQELCRAEVTHTHTHTANILHVP